MAPTIAEVHQLLTRPGSPFEIVEQEVGGRRMKTWKSAPPTLRSVLDMSRLHGDKIFLVYEDERTSFAEHFARCAELASVLVRDFGVTKGDRVAIAMRNFPEWSIAFWATVSVGAVAVPLNAWWTGEELAYGLADSGAKVVFVDGERAERLASHVHELPGIERIVVVRGEEPLPPGQISFDPLIAGASSASTLPPLELGPDDDATIFYTSGTTGRPKGAIGTHRNMCSNLTSLAFGAVRSALRAGQAPPSPGEPRPQTAQLLSVPLFHATGCHSILCSNLAFGGKLVMMYKWDPARALELIEREKITQFGGVPAMVWQVLEHPDFRRRDLSSVQAIGYGGAPAAPELVRRIKEQFPKSSPSQGYGLTETSSVTTLNSSFDYEQRPDSVGAPVPVCEVKIVGEGGKEVPPGEIGEIWIYGPNVVKGYWNKPEATAETFPNGWLRSGDVGRLDDEGFLYILDRAKDMLIRGGENVYCVEVESVLYQHPDVMDAAVVGIPHRVLGEEVGAVVQLVPDSKTTEQDLREHVARHLASFKVPVKVEIRKEPLPRNANGKILKRELKHEMEKYAS